ncbi:MAG: TPM domain-containing protein, partial [Lachnospiraceae bacterium]|nr:TPM domain-containing protein [Lachnospiraceae bacterium]
EIVTFGGADELVSKQHLEYIKEHALNYNEEYGVYGVLYSTKRYLSNYLDDRIKKEPEAVTADNGTAEESRDEEKALEEEIEETETETDTGTINGTDDPKKDSGENEQESPSDAAETKPDTAADNDNGTNETDLSGKDAAEKPAWYVEDISTFELYHDDNAPRVVDDADIFSDDEEKAMSARLWELRDELDKDIVVFTDMSEYGLGKPVYAADFYEMNGYGRGDEYEGAVLFICMDPNNRGWWTSCMGSVTMGLYKEDVANAIDDKLYEYMKAGDYAKGVSDWMENFRLMYLKGNPFAPDWLVNPPSERFHDKNAPRIDDTALYLDPLEKKKIEEHAAEISEKYGIDIVIHTAPVYNAIGLNVDEYAKKYYEYNGYGTGDGFEGLLLVILKNEDYNTKLSCLYGEGSVEAKLKGKNYSRLLGNLNDAAGSDRNFYKAFDRYLDQTEHMLKTGRVPRSGWYWSLAWILGTLGGSITGGSLLSGAKRKMETPAIKGDADMYLVKETVSINGSDHFVTRNTSRKYSPVERSSSSSSGSSSSGRSSYSSSYSSSSGHSHSGSGRSF